MHTFNGKTCRIHFNSDVSGNIRIIDKDSNEEITIDGKDILDFVAEYIRSKRISTIEQMNTDDILGLK